MASSCKNVDIVCRGSAYKRRISPPNSVIAERRITGSIVYNILPPVDVFASRRSVALTLIVALCVDVATVDTVVSFAALYSAVEMSTVW